MAKIDANHPLAPHLVVILDGAVLEGYNVVSADTDAGTVTCYPSDEKQRRAGDRTTLFGVVKFAPASNYFTVLKIIGAFPEFAGVLIDTPTSLP